MWPETELLLHLLIAHVIGDFVLRSRNWPRNVHAGHWRSKELYAHGVLQAVLAWVAMGFMHMAIAGMIGGVHIASVLLRSYRDKEEQSAKWFVIDQAAPLLAVSLAWWWITGAGIIGELRFAWHDKATLAWVLAAMVLMWPTGNLIAIFTNRWATELEGHTDNLRNAGRWIGLMERLLVLLFMANGFFAAIGFLLAAKSVFRFGDLKEPALRKRTEYVLIGTLLSFGIAVAVSVLAITIAA